VAGNYSVFIRNGAINRSYCSLVAMTVGNATYSITIPGDTTGTWAIDNTTGLQLGFTLASGSTFTTTGNAWTAGNFIAATGQSNGAAVLNQYINLTNVQLEVGSTATSFDYRPYGTELALCQRYLPTYNYVGGAGGGTITGQCISTTQAVIPIPFSVFARTIATGISISASTDFLTTTSAGGVVTTTAVAFNTSNALNGGTVLITVASGLVAGNATNFGAGTVNAKLQFTGCEL
jgi:hypothetical protein